MSLLLFGHSVVLSDVQGNYCALPVSCPESVGRPLWETESARLVETWG